MRSVAAVPRSAALSLPPFPLVHLSAARLLARNTTAVAILFAKAPPFEENVAVCADGAVHGRQRNPKADDSEEERNGSADTLVQHERELLNETHNCNDSHVVRASGNYTANGRTEERDEAAGEGEEERAGAWEAAIFRDASPLRPSSLCSR